MNAPGCEQEARFSTKLDLAIELALAELPDYRSQGHASERQSRQKFLRAALIEGICTIANHTRSGRRFSICGGWRFDLQEGDGVAPHWRQYYDQQKEIEDALAPDAGSEPH